MHAYEDWLSAKNVFVRLSAQISQAKLAILIAFNTGSYVIALNDYSISAALSSFYEWKQPQLHINPH